MKRWSLNLKISVVIAVLMVGSLIIAGMGLYQMNQINNSLVEITDVRVKKLNESQKLKDFFNVQIINERNYMLNTSQERRRSTEEMVVKRDEEMRNLIIQKRLGADPATEATLVEYLKTYEAWYETHQQMVHLMEKGEEKTAVELILSKGREMRLAGEALSEKMVAYDLELMLKKRAEAEHTFNQARVMTIVISVISLILGGSLAFLILRAASVSIHQVITNLTDNSQQVTQAAQQIASASEQLSGASTEQASSLEETVATLEELTSMVRQNTHNAEEAARLSSLTCEVASQGEKEIRGLMGSMDHISGDSKKIAEITGVVDDIAFQTNLLALNAAVEAARAGEQGKGFAVVAEAVRNLAQRSATAAKDIAELIHGSVAKIDVGSKQAAKSGKVLEEILSSIKKVSDLNAEIAAASGEQSNGIEQIGKAMNQLDQVTQVNAATSEEAAASAQELSGQAQRLNGAVGVLRQTIDGANSKASAESVTEFSPVSSPVLVKNLQRAA
ncbi:MAG: methyl-accepting chemotaxis protein [Bdellovibrio sp.]